jgi:hypothetical protein
VGSSISRKPEECGGLTGRQLILFCCFRLSASFANFIILVLVALTAELEAAKKALSEEKIARLAVDQSLALEKVTQ